MFQKITQTNESDVVLGAFFHGEENSRSDQRDGWPLCDISTLTKKSERTKERKSDRSRRSQRVCPELICGACRYTL